jgi:hypothetical protein
VVKDKFADKGKDFAFQFLFDFGHALGKSDAVNLQKKSSCPNGTIIIIFIVVVTYLPWFLPCHLTPTSVVGRCGHDAGRPNLFLIHRVGLHRDIAGQVRVVGD